MSVDATVFRGDVGACLRVVGRGEQGPAMRVTFSKEGLATYRGDDETDALLPRDESSCTLRLATEYM